MANDPAYDLIALPSGTRTRSVLTIVSAIAILLTLIWLKTGGGTQFFSPKFFLTSYMGDGSGLSRSSDVRLNGVNIGKVREITISEFHTPQRTVRVQMAVQDRFKRDIPVDSIAALTADNLLGDKFINIRAGKAMRNVGDGSEIASLIVSGSYNPADLVASLQASIKSVNDILVDIETGKSPLAQLVKGRDLYDTLYSRIHGIRNTLAIYSDRDTPGGQLLFSDAYYNKLRAPILDVDHTLDQIQHGEGGIGQLVVSPVLYDKTTANIQNLHRTLADLNAGEGSGGQLLHGDQQYLQLQAQINALNDALDAIIKGNGTFAQMLRSSQQYESLEGQARGTRDFVKDFRENPRKYLRIKLR